MITAPCKGCTERCAIPNCHTTCEKYLKWRANDTKAKEEFKRRNQAPLHQIVIKGWY